MAELNERITVDPSVLVGKPVIRGTRISVEFVLGLMAERWSEADILKAYPGLAAEDIQACLAYARDVMSSERVSRRPHPVQASEEGMRASENELPDRQN